MDFLCTYSSDILFLKTRTRWDNIKSFCCKQFYIKWLLHASLRHELLLIILLTSLISLLIVYNVHAVIYSASLN